MALVRSLPGRTELKRRRKAAHSELDPSIPEDYYTATKLFGLVFLGLRCRVQQRRPDKLVAVGYVFLWI
jgi:hypothetical protein